MSFGKKIKQLREKNQMTLSEVAQRIGVATQTVFKYEKEIVTNIPLDRVEKFAKIFNTTPAYLMGWETEETNIYDFPDIKPIELKRFRMLGKIACGEPIIANEEYNTFVEADATIDADFCLTAQGDSMINANIFDGDIVFIKEMDEIPNGKIAAVLIEDEVLLKRFYKTDDTITLISENPLYEPKPYHKDQHLNIRILGKAVCVQHDLK